jgi:phage baseplate assembly protein V
MSMDAVKREIGRAMSNLRHALRASLEGMDIAAPVQTVNAQGLSGEALQAQELFQHFGFTSAPPAGAQLIVLPLGGRTSAAVVIASEHGAYRFELGAQGEAALYNQWGDVVHMKQGEIHMVAATQVTIDAPILQVNGQIKATGDITSDANVSDQSGAKSMAGMRATYNAHQHIENGGSGPTNTPSGAM